MRVVGALDTNMQKSLIYVGGRTDKDANGQCYATLAALTFDSSLKMISETVFRSSTNTQTCSALRVGINSGLILAGCFQSILVVEFINNSFIQIQEISSIHSSTLLHNHRLD